MKFLDQILAAIASKDEAAIKAVVMKARDAEEEEEEKKEAAEKKAKDDKEEEFKKETRDSIASLTKLVADCVKEMKDKAKDEEEEEAKRVAEKKKEEDEESEKELEEETGSKDARKAKDSAVLSESFESVKSMAEIIAPGVQIPTFDAAADPKKTFRDCVCGLRRKALQMATADADTAAIVTTVRGRAVDSAEILQMSCGQVRTIFNGVAAMKKNANNGKLTVDSAQKQQKTEDNLTPTQRFIANARAMKSGKK